MLIVVNILIALICLALFVLGMMSMFAPKRMVNNFSIQPDGAAGLNTIRGVIGGLFVAGVTMLLAGLATGETIWFLAVAILLGAVALGRIVGIVRDGFEKSVAPPLVLEFAMIAILLAAHVQMGTA